jgi:hypothetical protein
MSFMPTVASLASAGTETVRELPIPAWSYGALALACFMLLLGVLWSFRNTAAKYDTPIRVTDEGPGDGHGANGANDPGAHH